MKARTHINDCISEMTADLKARKNTNYTVDDLMHAHNLSFHNAKILYRIYRMLTENID